MHIAQHAILKRNRCRKILPRNFLPWRLKTSLRFAAVVSIQYVTKAGPGPKCKRDKTMKTSPIDITEEILGSRTLIVETNIEVRVRRSHSAPKPWLLVKEIKAMGIDTQYTPKR